MNARLLLRIVTATAFVVLMSGSASAQPGPAAASPAQPAAAASALAGIATATKLKSADIDLSVPESPAFIAIGLSPDTIVRPTTPREFATALLNGFDRNGNLQTGIAIDTVPYLVWAGSKVSLAQYKSSAVTQILSRTQVSFATTKGGGADDKSVKLAFGGHSTLYDSEDPRLNNDELLRCYSDIPLFRPGGGALPLDAAAEARLGSDREKFEREILRPAADACREQFRRHARWNGTSWIVAAASSWASPTGLAQDLDTRSSSFWTSVSYGFDGVPGLRENVQLIGHVRHSANELVADKKLPGGQEIRDTTLAGVRLRAGTSSFGLNFEAAYVRVRPEDRDEDVSTRLSFIAERRLAPNLWLNVSFSGDSGAAPERAQGLSILSAFKYAFTKDPTLAAR